MYQRFIPHGPGGGIVAKCKHPVQKRNYQICNTPHRNSYCTGCQTDPERAIKTTLSIVLREGVEGAQADGEDIAGEGGREGGGGGREGTSIIHRYDDVYSPYLPDNSEAAC